MTDWTGQKWEYHVTQHMLGDVGSPMQAEELDAAGSWGWELIMITPIGDRFAKRLVYTFKRPLPQAKIEMP